MKTFIFHLNLKDYCATKAKEAGLEPLARFLIELTDTKVDLLIKASEFLNLEKGIDTPQKALQEPVTYWLKSCPIMPIPANG